MRRGTESWRVEETLGFRQAIFATRIRILDRTFLWRLAEGLQQGEAHPAVGGSTPASLEMKSPRPGTRTVSPQSPQACHGLRDPACSAG
jgi:hypothetical protein